MDRIQEKEDWKVSKTIKDCLSPNLHIKHTVGHICHERASLLKGPRSRELMVPSHDQPPVEILRLPNITPVSSPEACARLRLRCHSSNVTFVLSSPQSQKICLIVHGEATPT